MKVIAALWIPAKSGLNEAFKGREPWEIVGMTSATILAAVWFYNIINHEENIKERLKKLMMKFGRKLPAIQKMIQSKIDELDDDFQKDAMKRLKGEKFFTTLPDVPMDHQEILKIVEHSVDLGDYDWKNGRVSGCVYRANDEELASLVKEVYGLASLTNPLHPDVFPGICKMEAEVVRIACQLFNGDDNSCGTMTTGGTESILLACKAYRDYANEVKGITKPEMVMPTTAHSAFDKAAQYLKIKVRTVPIHPKTYTVNLQDMRKAINRNTIMLVGSAPNFPYGTMDNITEISRLGLEFDVPVHVDACLGGFLIPFMRQVGYYLQDYDFSLPGVCSISADTHKYGYAPKGSSVVLYRDKKYRHHQYTISTEWPGGIYGSPTINGSRAGGIIAACWATMMYFGRKGYLDATQKIIYTARYIEKELRKLQGIYVMGKPATSVIAVASDDFNIFRLSEALNKRGWNLNTLQFPSALHICVTLVHTEKGVAEKFVADLKQDLESILKAPGEQAYGMYAIYGMSQGIADRSVVKDITRCFIDSMYYTPSLTSSKTDELSTIDE
ncbi:unnamed protein product [Trichogramma brassicae]|uniref:sphinganine-1-phosphate aldolase n=1 Tax=Trichogramma brassicae TaxID=86971 RepID=A0A6H5IIL4_9HYME|nr:unnamed protein product [Trichogramma brassicae]